MVYCFNSGNLYYIMCLSVILKIFEKKWYFNDKKNISTMKYLYFLSV